MRFFDRFRAALARYADGVHVVGDPADEAALAAVEARLGRALPPPLRDFLLQWDGAVLFHEDVELHGTRASGLAVAGARLLVGQQLGAEILVECAAPWRVWTRDPETERARLCGSGFERWLDAVMAREALVYDRDGEFREAAFDEGELAPRVARRRAEAAIKVDPEAAAWHEELAELHLDAGESERAAAALQRVVALDPSAADAWFSLGRLLRASGDVAPAIAAFRAAAAAEPTDEEAAFAMAHAARLARAADDPDLAREVARDALLRHPALLAQQKLAAQHLLDDDDLDGSLERLELAQALAPEDPEVARSLGLLRARRALRPV